MSTARLLEVLAILTTPAIVCARGDPNTVRFTYLRDGVEYCNVHDVRLEEDTVPLLSGTWITPPEHRQGELALFPNARDFLASCIGSPRRTAKVLYCPACRKTQSEYYAEVRRRTKQELLDKIAGCKDVKAWRGEHGDTLLHLAAEEGFSDIVKMLLARGLDVNARSKYGDTALHSASGLDWVDAAKLLIEAGADVNARDADKCAPLHLAGPEVARVLLEHGADVNPLNEQGQTPLGQAKMFGDDDRDFCEYLEDKGAYCDPNFITLVARCPAGNSDESSALLRRAVAASEYNAVKTLIKKSANLHIRDEKGRTLLHQAIDDWERPAFGSWPNLHVLRLLVGSGVNVDAQDNEGQSPLHLAVKQVVSTSGVDYLSVVRCLIDAGADVGLKDADGCSPLAYCTYEAELIYLLVGAGADVNVHREYQDPLIYDAIFAVDAELVEFLIKAGADMTAENRAGQSPLEYATQDEWKKVVQRMIDAKEDEAWIEEYREECQSNMKRIRELLER